MFSLIFPVHYSFCIATSVLGSNICYSKFFYLIAITMTWRNNTIFHLTSSLWAGYSHRFEQKYWYYNTIKINVIFQLVVSKRENLNMRKRDCSAALWEVEQVSLWELDLGLVLLLIATWGWGSSDTFPWNNSSNWLYLKYIGCGDKHSQALENSGRCWNRAHNRTILCCDERTWEISYFNGKASICMVSHCH